MALFTTNRMSKKYEYETILIKSSTGVFAEFPFDSFKEFGTRKAIRVKVSFDGHAYSMSLMPRGNNSHWMHIKKDIRDGIGKAEGDSVKISLEQDFVIPEIPVPDYLQWLLDDDPAMKKAFHKLPVSARKFWVEYLEETKNDDTKVERINKLFEYIRLHSPKKNLTK